ncbi:hypothetical protein Tco_1071570, partial [Tanacetum coccineum]
PPKTKKSKKSRKHQTEANVENIENDSDYYDSDDYEDIENVDFQTEADDNVVVKDFSTHDGFLNKLCTTRAVFRGSTSRQQVDDIPEEDLQNEEIDAVFKIKKGVNYPTFDPTIPWDKMEPVLGMKYESQTSNIRTMLNNYVWAHGYQMWYMKNDWRSVLVFCGKNPDEGRCAGMKGNKNRKMTVIDEWEGAQNLGATCWLDVVQDNEVLPSESTFALRVIKDGCDWQVVGRIAVDVHEFLPQAEHRKCTRHIFANFKKKFSGVQLQSLFCLEDSITPSIRKRLELLKDKQRYWDVVPSGFRVMIVLELTCRIRYVLVECGN